MLEMSNATFCWSRARARSSTGAVLGRSGGSKTASDATLEFQPMGGRRPSPKRSPSVPYDRCLEGGPTTLGAGAGLSSCLRNDSNEGGAAPGGGGGREGVVGGVGASSEAPPKLDQLPPKPRPGGCDTAMAAAVGRFCGSSGAARPVGNLALPQCSR